MRAEAVKYVFQMRHEPAHTPRVNLIYDICYFEIPQSPIAFQLFRKWGLGKINIHHSRPHEKGTLFTGARNQNLRNVNQFDGGCDR